MAGWRRQVLSSTNLLLIFYNDNLVKISDVARAAPGVTRPFWLHLHRETTPTDCQPQPDFPPSLRGENWNWGWWDDLYLVDVQVAILNSLLEIGTDYRTISSYICSERDGGMYVGAVCEGLDLVLGEYRHTLSQLERDMLEEGDSLSLSLLHHKLSPHRPVLRYLVRLVTQLTSEQPAGVMILDRIYQASTTGVAGAGQGLRRVLAEGHKVLYKQLVAWLLQGQLYDPHQEFFIVKQEGEESFLVEDNETVSKSKSGSYRLDYKMVPSHLSHKLAEKIFFIGESIQLFESDKRAEVQGDVLRQRETEMYQALAKLRDQEDFVVGEFSKFVNNVRESVSAHLHHLVVEEAGLLGELSMVWDVFTMARGELFHAFIQLADRRLSQPPSLSTQHDTNQAWQAAVTSHTDMEDRLVGRARLVVGRETGRTGWEQLSVQYAVPWPLHLIVTPASLEQYNNILAFLLLVRRTQSGLHQLWAENSFADRRDRRRRRVVARETGSVEEESGVDTVAQTRQHMIFLVDNLQYYLMADVLDTQISGLKLKLAKTTNFEDVKTFHDQFLSKVQASIFLFNEPVHKCLLDTLSVCLKFCSSSSPTNQAALSSAFKRHSYLLLKLLSSLRHQVAPTSLAQLLTRLDYNRYFSRQERHNLGDK